MSQMPPHVLDSAFGVGAGTFDWVRPVGDPAFIARTGPAEASRLNDPTVHYRCRLEHLEPALKNAGGSVIFGRADDFPVLDGLAMYSLRMNGEAVREPHWHPNAAELNYVIEGSVRLTIVSPGGDVETVDLTAGDISYIPKAYFHHIETLGDVPRPPGGLLRPRATRRQRDLGGAERLLRPGSVGRVRHATGDVRRDPGLRGGRAPQPGGGGLNDTTERT